jgi:hypothetical protein
MKESKGPMMVKGHEHTEGIKKFSQQEWIVYSDTEWHAQYYEIPYKTLEKYIRELNDDLEL